MADKPLTWLDIFKTAFVTAVLTASSTWWINKTQLHDQIKHETAIDKRKVHSDYVHAVAGYRTAVINYRNKTFVVHFLEFADALTNGNEIAVNTPRVEIVPHESAIVAGLSNVVQAEADLKSMFYISEARFGSKVRSLIKTYLRETPIGVPDGKLKLLQSLSEARATLKATGSYNPRNIIGKYGEEYWESLESHPAWDKLRKIADAMEQEINDGE